MTNVIKIFCKKLFPLGEREVIDETYHEQVRLNELVRAETIESGLEE